MSEFWINNCAPMSAVQRLNFASFLAKLASTRICKDRMCQIALVLFRTSFEDGRDLRTTEEPDNEDPRQSIGPKFIQSELWWRSPTGFTPWRWMYWLKRLHEIQEEAKEANEERLEEYATDAI